MSSLNCRCQVFWPSNRKATNELRKTYRSKWCAKASWVINADSAYFSHLETCVPSWKLSAAGSFYTIEIVRYYQLVWLFSFCKDPFVKCLLPHMMVTLCYSDPLCTLSNRLASDRDLISSSNLINVKESY